MDRCEEFHPLIVGLLDGELTPEETQRINTHLSRCEHCRKEFDEMREITGKLKVPPFHEVEDEELERIWNSPHSRLVRNSGLVMMVGGYLTLILFALYEFFMSNDDEVLPKFAVAAMIIGFGITLGAVILARLKSYKHDKYTEVER